MSGLYSRRKGASAERDLVNYLRARGFVHADRNKIGSNVGDVTGIPGLVIECKATRTLTLPAWITQLEDEIDEANAETGVVVAKRVGRANPADWYAIQPLWRWVDLINEVGY